MDLFKALGIRQAGLRDNIISSQAACKITVSLDWQWFYGLRLADFHDSFCALNHNIFTVIVFTGEVWQTQDTTTFTFQSIMKKLAEVHISGCECTALHSKYGCCGCNAKITKVADFLCCYIDLRTFRVWVTRLSDLGIPDEPQLTRWSLKNDLNRNLVAKSGNHKRSCSGGGCPNASFHDSGCSTRLGGRLDHPDEVPPGPVVNSNHSWHANPRYVPTANKAAMGRGQCSSRGNNSKRGT